MLYIIIAFVTGGMVILSMVINSHLAKRIGVFQGTLINYVVGLLGIIIVIFTKQKGINLTLKELYNMPSWVYLGGVIGVGVVAASNIVIPKIPTIYSTLLIFIGQIVTGIIIDYFTSNVVSTGKILGSFFILAGLLYNFYIDKQELSVKETLEWQ
ncbi:transporter family-2 protein [Clostridium tetanomorphum]|uniref:EamA-like transporter family protein n=1 Tax=Clostridium tetanomorphum TaxID=1553 RepID=A0A923EDQ9_CLOTT|nr:DMT family transporter [Clostridium tetanomorphum]KAJ51035.1 hypothetical protein CTM_14928 [Clostridium tetanomorphum DSM 665]MBC2399344.1 EamA-like transporter family protein [Clostridium tetanomorphum]MBP1865865.1 transporter family-2 protein [Clostridium tetanomorphum]NRS85314.1 transporter family-2 protein [Clostridium tetanomorphum]NRZ98493.1 transporter family-2 protein [Clostridium tetanomorphum]